MKHNHKVEPEDNLTIQSYDGATNMMGPKVGVALRTQEVCAFTLPNHCASYGSALPAKGVFKELKYLANLSATTQDMF